MSFLRESMTRNIILRKNKTSEETNEIVVFLDVLSRLPYGTVLQDNENT